MKNGVHQIFLSRDHWDKAKKLSKFYGQNTNTSLVNVLIEIAFEMMTKHQRTINSIGSLEKLMFDQIKQLDNQTKLIENCLMNLTLLSSFMNKTDKNFRELKWEEVKNNKHEILKLFSESKK